jgi:hypothetical protein
VDEIEHPCGELADDLVEVCEAGLWCGAAEHGEGEQGLAKDGLCGVARPYRPLRKESLRT